MLTALPPSNFISDLTIPLAPVIAKSKPHDWQAIQITSWPETVAFREEREIEVREAKAMDGRRGQPLSGHS